MFDNIDLDALGGVDEILKAVELGNSTGQDYVNVANTGFEALKIRIANNPLEVLQEYPYIGPVTSYHLAKNLGFSLAKPDRHLNRIAQTIGYSDVQSLCNDISSESGDSIPVVDIVLWRYATLRPDYLSIFDSQHGL